MPSCCDAPEHVTYGGGVHVRVNGEDRELAEGTTVTGLVELLGLGTGWVVVERNGEPVDRSRMGTTALSDGDVLEVVRAVAGG